MGDADELRSMINAMVDDLDDIDCLLMLRGDRFKKAHLLAVREGLDAVSERIDAVVAACEEEGLTIVNTRREGTLKSRSPRDRAI